MPFTNQETINKLRSHWLQRLRRAGIHQIPHNNNHHYGGDIESILNSLIYQISLTSNNNEKDFSTSMEDILHRILSKPQQTALYLVDRRDILLIYYQMLQLQYNPLDIHSPLRIQYHCLQLALSPNYPRTVEEEREYTFVMKTVNELYTELMRDPMNLFKPTLLQATNNGANSGYSGGGVNNSSFLSQQLQQFQQILQQQQQQQASFQALSQPTQQQHVLPPPPVVPMSFPPPMVPSSLLYGSTVTNQRPPQQYSSGFQPPSLPPPPPPTQSNTMGSNHNQQSMKSGTFYVGPQQTDAPTVGSTVRKKKQSSSPNKINAESDIMINMDDGQQNTTRQQLSQGEDEPDETPNGTSEPRPRGRPRKNPIDKAKKAKRSTVDWSARPARFAILKDILRRADFCKESTQKMIASIRADSLESEDVSKPSVMELIVQRRNRAAAAIEAANAVRRGRGRRR